MSDNLELKKELCKKLKCLKTFKWCINPEHLQSLDSCSILAKVHYEKLDVTVIEVGPSFYVIAFQTSQYNKKNTVDEDNKIYHDDDFFEDNHNRKWTKNAFNIFDIPTLISEVLKNL